MRDKPYPIAMAFKFSYTQTQSLKRLFTSLTNDATTCYTAFLQSITPLDDNDSWFREKF